MRLLAGRHSCRCLDAQQQVAASHRVAPISDKNKPIHWLSVHVCHVHQVHYDFCHLARQLLWGLLQVALALKALYEDDIVVEELIIAWHGKPSAGKVLGVPAPAAKAVRQAAAKFVEWLQEAESDEESDESEDSLAEEE